LTFKVLLGLVEPRRKDRMLLDMMYYIHEKTIEEYRKFSKEVSLPFWKKVQGFKKMRAYVEPGSRRIKVLIEFDNYESWGKLMDNPEYKEIMRKFEGFTHGLRWYLWSESERWPDPITP
jgi:hypothetical protein